MKNAHLMLICLLAVSGSLTAQQVYRSVDEQGNVSYSGEPPANAQAVETISVDPGPSADQRREAEKRASEMEQAAQGAVESASESEARRQMVREAQENLMSAEKALEEAKVVGPGDRKGTASGGSRLTEAYQERVEAAEADVAAARKNLQEVQ
mgnify:FL=1